jgi:hypothetical protein
MIRTPEGYLFGHEECDVGQPVLVKVRESGQEPQLVGGVGVVPAILRLQPLDDCLRGWVDAPDHALAFVREVSAVTDNGELRISGHAPRELPLLMSEGKFICEVVKRCPKIVDAVANDGAESSGGLLEDFDAKELVAALNVELGPKSIGVFFEPTANFRLYALQVLESPV